MTTRRLAFCNVKEQSGCRSEREWGKGRRAAEERWGKWGMLKIRSQRMAPDFKIRTPLTLNSEMEPRTDGREKTWRQRGAGQGGGTGEVGRKRPKTAGKNR